MCSDDCCDCCSYCDEIGDSCRCCVIVLNWMYACALISTVCAGVKGGPVRTEKETEINIKQPIKIYTISN